jgi:hypothetical protein
MEVFSVASVSGSIGRQVVRAVSCDVYKICLTSQVLPSQSVFIYFKDYSDTEQSLTYPSERLVETAGTSVILTRVYDGRGGPLQFSRAANHTCH